MFVDTAVPSSEPSPSNSPIVIEVPTNPEPLPSTSFYPTMPVLKTTRNRRRPVASGSNTPESIINQPKIPKTKKLNPTWRKGNFTQNPEFIKFSGEVPMPFCNTEMTTPKEFFSYFFDDELLNFIAEQSTLYSVQTNPEKPFKMSKSDVQNFLGIMSMMSIVHVPNTRSLV